MRKDQVDDMYKVCLPAFLLGVWHFIVVNRKDNKIGQDTYDIWCPKNDHGPREYQGVMGESIARKIDVYTLNPDEIEGSVEPQVEEKISQADQLYYDGRHAAGNTVDPEQYRKVMKRSFEKLEQRQHYRMMMHEKD